MISFSYNFNSDILQNEETEWHIAKDSSKTIDDISLGKDIKNGAIVVQTSLDGENWYTDLTNTNVFTAEADFSEAIYTAKDIQLQNGCYYRIIAAYELQRKTGENKIGPIKTDEIETKKVAEVYEIYAVSEETNGTAINPSTSPRKELGTKAKTGTDNGYSGEKAIDKDDPHFGWDLGTFVMNGYTRETSDGDTPVFLKNVGDKVTLWFTLEQDINCLNGDDTLTIANDKNGYDKAFEVPQSDFGQGTLIIRYTDYEGNAHDPIIYEDFLAANVSTGADTRVQLFEEGNYEVTLDYEIKNNPRQVGSVSIIPTYTDYKISFSFEIRNGNCMVFPMDASTGEELSNYAITGNGFKLDMARSRYLTIDVKRSVINVDSSGNAAEDVRFNRPAKDGETYTDEGIYTFTVKNLYTGESTTKTICVGSDNYYHAISKNEITVEELNSYLSSGSEISADGTITAASVKTTVTKAEDETETNEAEMSGTDTNEAETNEAGNDGDNSGTRTASEGAAGTEAASEEAAKTGTADGTKEVSGTAEPSEEENKGTSSAVIVILGLVCAAALIGGALLAKKKKENGAKPEDKEK